MMAEKTTLTAIIVNFKTPELTLNCLESLGRERDLLQDCHLEARIVDNQSDDESLEIILNEIKKKHLGGWTSLQVAPSNGGYGAGNNQVLREIDTLHQNKNQFYLILNPDVELKSGAIEKLLKLAVSNPRVAVVGPRLEYEDGRPQISAFRFHSVLSELASAARIGPITRWLARSNVGITTGKTAAQVDWVSGACFLVKAEALSESGLFDEEFFLYFEESELCHRLHKLGWEVWIEPEARAIHLKGRSTGFDPDQAETATPPQHWEDSRQLYFRKTRGQSYAMAADAARFLGHLLRILSTPLYVVIGRSKKEKGK
jgi:GT2 family glycosyltransferase